MRVVPGSHSRGRGHVSERRPVETTANHCTQKHRWGSTKKSKQSKIQIEVEDAENHDGSTEVIALMLLVYRADQIDGSRAIAATRLRRSSSIESISNTAKTQSSKYLPPNVTPRRPAYSWHHHVQMLLKTLFWRLGTPILLSLAFSSADSPWRLDVSTFFARTSS